MPAGRPPKPIEVKRRLGNPGKRALPDRAGVALLPGGDGIPPEPVRPLGKYGRQLWDRVWQSGAVWLAREIDCEMVLLICEQMDERMTLRGAVLAEGDWRARAALRAVEQEITSGLAVLGFNPSDRTRLGVAEVRPLNALEQYRAGMASTRAAYHAETGAESPTFPRPDRPWAAPPDD